MYTVLPPENASFNIKYSFKFPHHVLQKIQPHVALKVDKLLFSPKRVNKNMKCSTIEAVGILSLPRHH